MSGKCRPSLRKKTLENVKRSNLSNTDKECIVEVFERYEIGIVEVVRCRNCKHSVINELHQNKPLICCLTKMCGTVDPNWYCADGEKALKEREKE